MRTLLGVLSIVFFSAYAQAQVDPSSWEPLLNKITAEGTQTDAFNGIYKILSNQEQSGDLFKADYISTVGGFDNEGLYYIGHVEMVSEDWKTDADGNWDIDQWLFVISKEGEVSRGMHIHLIEDVAGRVLLHERIPATEKEMLSTWERELKLWYRR